MINLAHALNEIPVLFEMLSQRNNIRQSIAKVCDEIPDLGRVRTSAGHQTGTRWRTDGLLTIGTIENHAGFGNTVNIRALDIILAVATQFRAQVIHGNEKNVGPLFYGFSRVDC